MKTETGALTVKVENGKAIILFNERPLLMLTKEDLANLQRACTKVWKEMS